jgi:hypothetical protein
MGFPSSEKKGHQILGVLSAKRAEALLTSWVNIPGSWPIHWPDHDEMQKFSDSQRRMQRLFRDLDEGDRQIIGHPWLRDFLRLAWNSRDLREREWFIFKMREFYNDMVRRREMTMDAIREDERQRVHANSLTNAVPKITGLEAALYHFLRNARRARRCANEKCETPYFFMSRKGQRYCSDICAIPARLAGQRRWWNENRGKSKRR